VTWLSLCAFYIAKVAALSTIAVEIGERVDIPPPSAK